jgi:predicted small integral membrane protein
MAWTPPTAIFFALIAVAIATLTVLELRHPTRRRRGLLPIATTRGDRFFISLLAAAFVHIAWLAATDASALWATLISAAVAAGLLRWG